MAVTRADKTAELESLEGAFKGHDVAILIDYKGINVPQVTQLRTELRKAKASYKVVKNTLARRALKGTPYETLSAHFEGMTAVAYTKDDPVALAKALTTFMKSAPTLQIKAAVVQGQAIKGSEVLTCTVAGWCSPALHCLAWAPSRLCCRRATTHCSPHAS